MSSKFPLHPGRYKLREELYFGSQFLYHDPDGTLAAQVEPYLDQVPVCERWPAGSCWPGIEAPDANVYHWWLMSDSVIIGELRGNPRRFVVDHRVPDEDYWPTESEARALFPGWVDTMYQQLLHHWEKVGDVEGDEEFSYMDDEGELQEMTRFSTPQAHWFGAKRRYGIKRNPLTRIVFLLEYDPEGRFRCFEQDLPPYLRAMMTEVDRQVALRLGIEPDEDDLYMADD